MRYIVGISGASGVVMGLHLVRAFKEHDGAEVHLVVTEGAKTNWRIECRQPLQELLESADYAHDDHDLAALISSGSYITAGMAVLPCSMKTLAAIAHGYAGGLLVRAADVCLKEGRKVALCPREMPLNKTHLKNMLTAAELGCAVIPPMLTFYNKPASLEDQIEHVVGKVLMQFGLEHKAFKRWEGQGGGEVHA